MDFKIWLEARTEKVLVYHGTSPKNFKSIMSQGLQPYHPDKAWDEDENTTFTTSSRKSLDGIYVTTNLMKALSAASQGRNSHKDGRLLVVAEVQPKTGFMDEDDLNRLSVASDNEYMIASLYGALAKNNNKFVNDGLVDQFYQRFKDSMKWMLKDLKSPAHPELQKRLAPLLWQTFVKAVTRQASYIDDWTFRKAFDYTDKIQKPNKAKAEQDFLRTKEILSQTLKQLANPLNFKKQPFLFSSRIMQPIGFKGSNKIISIIFDPPDYKEFPKILYGNPPPETISDWERSVGRFYEDS